MLRPEAHASSRPAPSGGCDVKPRAVMPVRDECLLGLIFRIEFTVTQSRSILFIGVAFGARRVVEQAHPLFAPLLAGPGPGVLRAAVAPVPDEVHRADSCSS